MKSIVTCLFIFLSFSLFAQDICNPMGNLVIFSNYTGGAITINVDQDIPNLKIGICTYEAIEVTIVGAFASNVTEVIYAGFNGNGCTGVTETSFIGVDAGIVSIYDASAGLAAMSPFLGDDLNGIPFVNCMVGAGGSCGTSTAGGTNSSVQIVQYFLSEFGVGTQLFSHFTQSGCLTGTFNLSAGGNCCLETPTTSVNPIYLTNGLYNFLPDDTLICNGGLLLTTPYEVLVQSPFYPGYVWSDGTTGPSLFVSTPGVYSFTVVDYCFNNGAFLTDTIVVLSCCDVEVAIEGNIVLCPQETSILMAVPETAGNYTYIWSDGTIGATVEVISGASNDWVSVTAVNTVTGCTGTDSIQLSVSESPIITLNLSEVNACSFDTVQIEVGATNVLLPNVLFSNGESSNPYFFVPSSETELSVTVIDPVFGCSSDTSFVFTTAFEAQIVAPPIICEGSTTNLSAIGVSGSGSYEVVWSTGQMGATISVDTFPSDTLSMLLVDLATGCSSTDTTVLQFAPGYTWFSLVDTLFGCDNKAVEISVPNTVQDFQYWYQPVSGLAVQLLPNLENGTNTFLLSDPGTYSTFKVGSNAFGCTDTLYGQLTINESDSNLYYFPNIFSPNTDNVNDTWSIYSKFDVWADFELIIFDRWGNLIFEATPQLRAWDGNFRGEPAPIGNYNYYFNGALLQTGCLRNPYAISKGDFFLTR